MQGGRIYIQLPEYLLLYKIQKTPAFRKYARQTVKNAGYLAKQLLEKKFDVVSGGTDKHLVLIDLRRQNVSGWFVGWALETANIIANRNTVPYDTASPYYPSGLEIGNAGGYCPRDERKR